MTQPSVFVAMSDQKMAALIDSAAARVGIAVPAIRNGSADALCRAIKRLGADRVSVVVDLVEKVHQLGFGDHAAIRAIQTAGGLVRHSPGLRIGVLVCDDRAWVFAPTALSLEPENENDETPNAIALPATQIESVVWHLFPIVRSLAEAKDTADLVSLATVEIGKTIVTAAQVEQTRSALAQSPPLDFKAMRLVRKFERIVQHVDINLRGALIHRRRVEVPKELQGLTSTAEIASRLRTTFELLEKNSGCSSKPLEILVEGIRNEFTKSLGKPWGRVMLRIRRAELDASLVELRKQIDEHRIAVKQAIEEQLEKSRDQLIDYFLPLVEKAPLDGLFRTIRTPKPSVAEIRDKLERIMKGIFPSASELVSKMGLDVQFRGVAYETLMDRRFMKKIIDAFPDAGLEKSTWRKADALP